MANTADLDFTAIRRSLRRPPAAEFVQAKDLQGIYPGCTVRALEARFTRIKKALGKGPKQGLHVFLLADYLDLDVEYVIDLTVGFEKGAQA